MKIGIIGLGMVGKEILFNLFRKMITDKIYVLDLNQEKTMAEIMDLQDSIPFDLHYAQNHLHFTQDYTHIKECDIVIINVSIPSRGGMGSRLDALKDNAKLLTQIAHNFKNVSTQMKVIITSNPVDLMAQVFIKESGMNPQKVIGTGTYLDTARLQFYLSTHYGVSTKNIQSFVIGEHGDSSVIAWSLTKIAGLSIDEYSQTFGYKMVDKNEALEFVRRRGLDIFRARGYTDHGIGSSVYNIVMSIISDQKLILPVSTLLSGQYGLNNIVLGLPCILGSHGIEKILPLPLEQEEIKALEHSAKILQTAWNDLQS